MKKFFIVILLLVFGLIAGCSNQESSTGSKQKNQENAEWLGDFADLPSDFEKDLYQLKFEKSKIDINGEEKEGYLLSGNNASDDLFMFLHKAFSTDKPNQELKVNVSFDMATNVAGGMVGIGGSPGESVYVKAGVVNKKPEIEKKQQNGHEMLLLNLDKGNQAEGGLEMIAIGNISKEDGSEDESYQLKHFEQEFTVTTNENGEFFVIIGTDSGFEGPTTLYYMNLNVDYE